MSAYQMASLHGKHSKHVTLPLGDRWGVPEGTSVADCLTWNRPAVQPPAQPPPSPELVLEEETRKEVYFTPTSVNLEAPTPGAVTVTSPVKRAPAPTPKHMATTPLEVTPKCTHEWRPSESRLENKVVKNRPPTPADGLRYATRTPVPPASMRRYNEPQRVDTPPSYRHNYVKTINQNQKNGIKKSKKPVPPSPALTFQQYLQATEHPLAVTGRPCTPQQISSRKVFSYPHYNPNAEEDDVEYIVKQTRSLKVRTPINTGRSSSRNGGVVRATNLPPPRTELDDQKENAMIQAIREELHSSRSGETGSRAGARSAVDRYQNGEYEYDEKDPRASVYLTSQQQRPGSAAAAAAVHSQFGSQSRQQSRPLSRSFSQQSRPRSSQSRNQLELVREKKTVGFMDENEYYRYLTYLEDKYGDETNRGTPQQLSGSSSHHFNDWRGTTDVQQRKGKPAIKQAWRSNKRGTTDSPAGKVNVEMDCPENSDMTISLRVRNTPTATAVCV